MGALELGRAIEEVALLDLVEGRAAEQLLHLVRVRVRVKVRVKVRVRLRLRLRVRGRGRGWVRVRVRGTSGLQPANSSRRKLMLSSPSLSESELGGRLRKAYLGFG